MFGNLLILMVLLILHANNMLLMTGMLHQLICRFARTAHGLHVQLTKLGTQPFAKVHAGQLLQTECITQKTTTLLSAKIRCKKNFLKMDQWNAQFKPLTTLMYIEVVFIVRFCQIQFNSIMPSLSLVGAKMRHLVKCTGLEETHGVHTGVLVDSSELKWEETILALKQVALLVFLLLLKFHKLNLNQLLSNEIKNYKS